MISSNDFLFEDNESYMEIIHNPFGDTLADIKEVEVTTTLFENQKKIYDSILQITKNDGMPKLIFIHGAAQSGKTVLLRKLHQDLRNLNSNSKSGTISYNQSSKFYNGDVIQQINNSTPQELRSIEILCLDCVHLINRDTFEELESKFRDANETEEPFGGKTVIMTGDFFQLDAFPNKKRVSLSIVNSNLFGKFTICNLEYQVSNEYTDLLLKFRKIHGDIEVPEKLFVNSKEELIKQVFGEPLDPQKVIHKVILAPNHTDVIHINNKIMNSIKEDPILLKSETKLFNSDGLEVDRADLLDMDLKEAPRANIELKNGCIIMLIKNVNKIDLTKGTRLIFRRVAKTKPLLLCSLLSDPGRIRFIPRDIFTIEIDNQMYTIERRQYPIEVGYTMTVHRSFARHFDKVGVYNIDTAWTHGIVYTALSRCNTIDGIRFFSNKYDADTNGNHQINNIVDESLVAFFN